MHLAKSEGSPCCGNATMIGWPRPWKQAQVAIPLGQTALYSPPPLLVNQMKSDGGGFWLKVIRAPPQDEALWNPFAASLLLHVFFHMRPPLLVLSRHGEKLHVRLSLFWEPTIGQKIPES